MWYGEQTAEQRSVITAARASLVLGLLFCTTGASCTRSMRSPFAAWQPPAPEVLVTGSSLDQIITAVNNNAARIQSVQTNNASITVPGMTGIPLLRGNIAAQRPGRFRLQASTALTGPEVDLGSNDNLFWFWVKRNQPPALYYARHEQFAGSAAQQFMPIEPQWLLDAIGFAEFRASDVHDGPLPLGDGKVEISSVLQTRTGTLTKKTVVNTRFAWVMEQHLYDSRGTLVASAISKSHRYYPQAGVSLPEQVRIEIPASGLSLSIDMGTVEINTISENPQLWALPSINGAPLTDLGAATANAATPRMGNQIADANWYGPGPAAGGPAPIAPPASLPATQPASVPSMAIAMAPPAMAQPSTGPPPQFIQPSGIELAPPTAPATTPYPGAQQIPAGGIADSSAFIR